MAKNMAFTLLTMGGLTASCDLPDSGSEPQADDVGVAQIALGEAACGTYSLTGTGTADGIIKTYSSAGVYQDSPDWTYDWPNCPYQYITEFTNLPATLVGNEGVHVGGRFYADAGNPANVFATLSNQFICERTRLYVGVYVWNTNVTNPSTVYTYHAKGTWSGGSCNQSVVSASAGIDQGYVSIGAGKYKARVATRAYFCSGTDCGSPSPYISDFRATNFVRFVDPPD